MASRGNTGRRRQGTATQPPDASSARAATGPAGAEDRTQTQRAKRILAAARELVSERGITGSHVIDIARAAGVSRGLVTYHFGTKALLLGEVMDADARDRLERLREFVGDAQSLDEIIAGIARTLGELLQPQRGMLALQELATLALRNEDIAARLACARAHYRKVLAEILVEHERAGLVSLRAEPTTVAAVLVALGQGIVNEQLADPEWDHTVAAQYALHVARDMLAPAT